MNRPRMPGSGPTSCLVVEGTGKKSQCHWSFETEAYPKSPESNSTIMYSNQRISSHYVQICEAFVFVVEIFFSDASPRKDQGVEVTP